MEGGSSSKTSSPAAPKCPDCNAAIKAALVDNASASRVDEYGSKLHRRKFVLSNDRPIGLWNVDRNDIRPPKPFKKITYRQDRSFRPALGLKKRIEGL